MKYTESTATQHFESTLFRSDYTDLIPPIWIQVKIENHKACATRTMQDLLTNLEVLQKNKVESKVNKEESVGVWVIERR